MTYPLPMEEDDEVEDLEDMDREERAALEACLDEGIDALLRGERAGMISGEESIRRLLERRG